MKRWIGKVALFATLSGSFAVASARLAMADGKDAPAGEAAHRGHHQGLLGQALKLDSLTSDQRTAIEKLVQAERTARVPARQADAHVLTTLAQQVEAGAIDPTALGPIEQAKESAEASARATAQELATKLHALLTPAQRGQLVDAIEAAKSAHGPHDGAGGRSPDGGHGGEALTRLSNQLGLSPQQTQQIASDL